MALFKQLSSLKTLSGQVSAIRAFNMKLFIISFFLLFQLTKIGGQAKLLHTGKSENRKTIYILLPLAIGL